MRTHWLPAKVLHPLKQLPEYLLEDRPRTFFLLVTVADRADLLAGLVQSDQRGPVHRNRNSIDELRTCFAEPDDLRSRMGSKFPVGSEFERLRALKNEPQYVVKVEKRANSTSFMRKITLGRTRNHDIVLRDPSVSKFHASFEVLENDEVLLHDHGSRNLTRVNGISISRPTRVYPGDDISFGKVRATLCTDRGLWHSLRNVA
ncbi:MAG: FHA domain-containing protein [Myxococcales bacterium]|nr:FHA domain-containing protein [Myxococcales bacterium]